MTKKLYWIFTAVIQQYLPDSNPSRTMSSIVQHPDIYKQLIFFCHELKP